MNRLPNIGTRLGTPRALYADLLALLKRLDLLDQSDAEIEFFYKQPGMRGSFCGRVTPQEFNAIDDLVAEYDPYSAANPGSCGCRFTVRDLRDAFSAREMLAHAMERSS